MDTAYQNALAQRETLAKRISKMEQQLDAARSEHDRAVQFIESWEHFAGLTPIPKLMGGTYMCGGEKVSARELANLRPKNPPKEEVAKMAVEVLKAHGGPMSRADLFAAMTAKGLILHGKEPAVVLSTMLWRMKTVVSFISGLGYWPIGHEMPGRQVLNGRVVTNYVVTEVDTDNEIIAEGAKKFYPNLHEEEAARLAKSLFE